MQFVLFLSDEEKRKLEATAMQMKQMLDYWHDNKESSSICMLLGMLQRHLNAVADTKLIIFDKDELIPTCSPIKVN